MKLAIPCERHTDETRVAASPETVKKLVGLGLDVVVETGAGAGASIADADFEAAGASIAPDAVAAVTDADIVFCVQRPTADAVAAMKRGANLIGMLAPFRDQDVLQDYAERGLAAFAMEFMPRITRAQSMDVLSSQANLAGYRAVIEACQLFGRAMPMMMTAAGTIAPGRVLVMGAGVAGLQAIATARRLGAIVSATDVRPAAKEQVESLGGNFVMVESEETAAAETAGGYAREMSEEYQRAQAALIAETLKKQDIAICTALIPGRPAPVLITEEMVKSMKPGSVIVDLAVEQGGNCPLSKPGECVEAHGVRIIGYRNMPGRLPVDASALYAKNLLNFLKPLIAESGVLEIDWEDEIILGTLLTRNGAVVHPALMATAE
ncbi:MAG TPA: Re/Si-specific NAD(P)(+) transhydrogenase subunit alpha [Alphaproteobacteria bacterium]|nr:Re/Si-specific NAD(P)(+) transhydrogenase subunit alpha [Alphaproteobacteria bacterium]